jgi:hypothetical protein
VEVHGAWWVTAERLSARFPCMTSRHSSDLPHAGLSSWSVVASHWGSCEMAEMGRPATPMQAVPRWCVEGGVEEANGAI